MNEQSRISKFTIVISIACLLAFCLLLQTPAFAANNSAKKPGKTSITRIAKTDKSITVKLSKARRASGYQIKFSTSKKFAASSTKTKTISSSAFSSNGKMLTVRSLKKDTNYYIKARAYKITKRGKVKYSKWSKIRTCKTYSTQNLSAPVKKLLNKARSWLNYSEYNNKFLYIIERYNYQEKVPVGYKLNSQDAWCAAFVSAVALESGLSDKVYPECSCWRMAKHYYKEGFWVADKSYVPKAGDIIFYEWSGKGLLEKPTGGLDHVGIVESVDNKIMTVIEGNYSNSVKRRTILTSNSCIAGYAVPDYEGTATDDEGEDDDRNENFTSGWQ